MRVGIISDTHLTRIDETIKSIADFHFADVDLIVHAGDIVEADILDVFSGKDVYAVCGNMDLLSVRKSYPQKMVLEVDWCRIGVIHGWGAPFGIEEKLIKEFKNIHCIIYGHTHQAVNYEKNGVLYFNPGSPTDRAFTNQRTIGILEINDNKTMQGHIIELP
jgi:putative phosphoesterase